MKTFFKVLAVTMAMAFAMNPDEGDHRDEFQVEAAKLLYIEEDSFLADLVGITVGKYIVTRQNFGVCSLTKLRTGTGEITIGFGAYGQVWIFTDELTDKL